MKLQEYKQTIHQLLEEMKPDQTINILEITNPSTYEPFIEIVKEYMRDHEWQAGLSFGKAFMELRKTDLSFILKNTKSKNVME